MGEAAIVERLLADLEIEDRLHETIRPAPDCRAVSRSGYQAAMLSVECRAAR
jgi:hypothetical protein